MKLLQTVNLKRLKMPTSTLVFIILCVIILVIYISMNLNGKYGIINEKHRISDENPLLKSYFIPYTLINKDTVKNQSKILEGLRYPCVFEN